MKKILSFFALLVSLPLSLDAQENQQNYLTGAVPEVDGKVVFSKEFSLPGITQQQIFERMQPWVAARAIENKVSSRQISSDEETGVLVAQRDGDLVFKMTAMALDQAQIGYILTVFCQPDNCRIEIGNIKYAYDGRHYTAENMITDREAIGKNGKLYPGMAKFRIKTIEFAEDVFDSVREALGIQKVTPLVHPQLIPLVPLQPQPQPQTPAPVQVPAPAVQVVAVPEPAHVAPRVEAEAAKAALSATWEEYNEIEPAQIPQNLLSGEVLMASAAAAGEFEAKVVSWGGLGELFGTSVAVSHSDQAFDKADIYTLTFYSEGYQSALKQYAETIGSDKQPGLTPVKTPDGNPSFGEASLVIECRKVISGTQESPQAKVCIGEILRVWIK